MLGPLLLGLLVGMKHALEADHVAAVAALATRVSSVADRVKVAGMWGLGHASAIVLMGVAVLALGVGMPPAVAHAVEGIVGLMLILLGADVLRRLRARRVHFHTHRHGDGTLHFHAHAHEPSRDHAASDAVHAVSDHSHAVSSHVHEHPGTTLPRAALVGSVHGLAGSAALLLVSVGSTRSTTEAIASLALFGVGSIAGMCALSLAISVPLRHLPRLGSASRMLEGAVGVVTMALGSWIAVSVLVGR